MDKTSGWQRGDQLFFFPIPLERRSSTCVQNGSSIPETKRSGSNHEFRISAYYDLKAFKGHLVQFWNKALSISIA